MRYGNKVKQREEWAQGGEMDSIWKITVTKAYVAVYCLL